MAAGCSHVVSGLVAKRRQIAREVDAAERYLARLRANLAHIDAVLRLCEDPHGGTEPDAIPCGLVPRRIRRFRSGELPRRVLDRLRGAGEPLTAVVEIAARVLAAKGLDPDNAECRALVRRGVTGCLRRWSRSGLIERVQGGAGGVRKRAGGRPARSAASRRGPCAATHRPIALDPARRRVDRRRRRPQLGPSTVIGRGAPRLRG